MGEFGELQQPVESPNSPREIRLSDLGLKPRDEWKESDRLPGRSQVKSVQGRVV
jgi:hypothetical protein